MGGMPSARGTEWKARDMRESRERFRKNMDSIFPEKERRPWWEIRDEETKKDG